MTEQFEKEDLQGLLQRNPIQEALQNLVDHIDWLDDKRLSIKTWGEKDYANLPKDLYEKKTIEVEIADSAAKSSKKKTTKKTVTVMQWKEEYLDVDQAPAMLSYVGFLLGPFFVNDAEFEKQVLTVLKNLDYVKEKILKGSILELKKKFGELTKPSTVYNLLYDLWLQKQKILTDLKISAATLKSQIAKLEACRVTVFRATQQNLSVFKSSLDGATYSKVGWKGANVTYLIQDVQNTSYRDLSSLYDRDIASLSILEKAYIVKTYKSAFSSLAALFEKNKFELVYPIAVDIVDKKSLEISDVLIALDQYCANVDGQVKGDNKIFTSLKIPLEKMVTERGRWLRTEETFLSHRKMLFENLQKIRDSDGNDDKLYKNLRDEIIDMFLIAVLNSVNVKDVSSFFNETIIYMFARSMGIYKGAIDIYEDEEDEVEEEDDDDRYMDLVDNLEEDDKGEEDDDYVEDASENDNDDAGDGGEENNDSSSNDDDDIAEWTYEEIRALSEVDMRAFDEKTDFEELIQQIEDIKTDYENTSVEFSILQRKLELVQEIYEDQKRKQAFEQIKNIESGEEIARQEGAGDVVLRGNTGIKKQTLGKRRNRVKADLKEEDIENEDAPEMIAEQIDQLLYVFINRHLVDTGDEKDIKIENLETIFDYGPMQKFLAAKLESGAIVRRVKKFFQVKNISAEDYEKFSILVAQRAIQIPYDWWQTTNYYSLAFTHSEQRLFEPKVWNEDTIYRIAINTLVTMDSSLAYSIKSKIGLARITDEAFDEKITRFRFIFEKVEAKIRHMIDWKPYFVVALKVQHQELFRTLSQYLCWFLPNTTYLPVAFEAFGGWLKFDNINMWEETAQERFLKMYHFVYTQWKLVELLLLLIEHAYGFVTKYFAFSTSEIDAYNNALKIEPDVEISDIKTKLVKFHKFVPTFNGMFDTTLLNGTPFEILLSFWELAPQLTPKNLVFVDRNLHEIDDPLFKATFANQKDPLVNYVYSDFFLDVGHLKRMFANDNPVSEQEFFEYISKIPEYQTFLFSRMLKMPPELDEEGNLMEDLVAQVITDAEQEMLDLGKQFSNSTRVSELVEKLVPEPAAKEILAALYKQPELERELNVATGGNAAVNLTTRYRENLLGLFVNYCVPLNTKLSAYAQTDSLYFLRTLSTIVQRENNLSFMTKQILTVPTENQTLMFNGFRESAMLFVELSEKSGNENWQVDYRELFEWMHYKMMPVTRKQQLVLWVDHSNTKSIVSTYSLPDVVKISNYMIQENVKLMIKIRNLLNATLKVFEAKELVDDTAIASALSSLICEEENKRMVGGVLEFDDTALKSRTLTKNPLPDMIKMNGRDELILLLEFLRDKSGLDQMPFYDKLKAESWTNDTFAMYDETVLPILKDVAMFYERDTLELQLLVIGVVSTLSQIGIPDRKSFKEALKENNPMLGLVASELKQNFDTNPLVLFYKHPRVRTLASILQSWWSSHNGAGSAQLDINGVFTDLLMHGMMDDLTEAQLTSYVAAFRSLGKWLDEMDIYTYLDATLGFQMTSDVDAYDLFVLTEVDKKEETLVMKDDEDDDIEEPGTDAKKAKVSRKRKQPGEETPSKRKKA